MARGALVVWLLHNAHCFALFKDVEPLKQVMQLRLGLNIKAGTASCKMHFQGKQVAMMQAAAWALHSKALLYCCYNQFLPGPPAKDLSLSFADPETI